MNSRAEIARAWDLFQLGAFAEADSLLRRFPLMPRRSVSGSGWLFAAATMRKSDGLAHGLLITAATKLAAVGRAHENAALATLGSAAAKNGCRQRSRWASGRSCVCSRALSHSQTETLKACATNLRKRYHRTTEQRVRYAALRAWVYGLHEQFEKQATHLLHALSLAADGTVDRMLVAHMSRAR